MLSLPTISTTIPTAISCVSRVLSKRTLGMTLILSLFAVAAHADGLVVVTEELSLSATQPVADLQVRNSAAEATTAQFNIRAWRQEGDRDQLTPDRRVIIHPQSIKLQPGDSARVRVVLRLSAPQWEEEAFRILIVESPQIPDVGAETAHSVNRRTIQRGSVPVFLLPPDKAKPRVTWSFEPNHDGTVILRASNNGRGHVRFNSASLAGPAGQSISKGNMSDILLPGGSRSWELAAEASPGVWLLTADTDAGPMRAKLELGPGLSIARALTLRD
jgi:P pilus assembly chaperone PapD